MRSKMRIKLILMAIFVVAIASSLTTALADEVVLGKDTKKLFPQELLDRYQGTLPQSRLATGELAGTAVLTGGAKKVTKVEIISVRGISGNNPFYQLDPINNSFKDGRVYPVAVDDLASYLAKSSTTSGGQSGGGGSSGGGGGVIPPSPSKYATINFTSEGGTAFVYFERFDSKLGATPVSTTYDPSRYDYVAFKFDYGSELEEQCNGNLTNIKAGETINVNYKVPRSQRQRSAVTISDSGNFDINLNAFTIVGSSGPPDASKAIRLQKQSFTFQGKAVFKYEAGTNWSFFSNLALARENSMASSDQMVAVGDSYYFYLMDTVNKRIAKITTYIVNNNNGTFTANVEMRDAGTSPCFSTTHSYCIPGAIGPERCP